MEMILKEKIWKFTNEIEVEKSLGFNELGSCRHIIPKENEFEMWGRQKKKTVFCQ